MATRKRGLGRGLSALIPDDPVEDEKIEIDDSDRINYINISLIEPNTSQPRRDFDEEALVELSNSIKKHGILQPIIVRKMNQGYQLVAGERRWRAAKEAGLKEIPAIIKELEEIYSTELALIENIQREDLNSVEEAYAYKELIDKYNLKQEELAEIIGKSRSYIANITRLLKLSKEILDLIYQNKISNGHGRALLAIEDDKRQIEIANIIIDKQLSVRETEKLIQDLNKKEKKNKRKGKKVKDAAILDIEESLRKILGTKVEIKKGRNKGKIEIEYYNNDDLERIINFLSSR